MTYMKAQIIMNLASMKLKLKGSFKDSCDADTISETIDFLVL